MSYTPHTFSAGGTTLTFIVIKGDILPPSEVISVTTRPGVPGGSFWQEGEQAVAFQVETEEDCEFYEPDTFVDDLGLVVSKRHRQC